MFIDAKNYLAELMKMENDQDKIEARYYNMLIDISIAIVDYREKHNLNQHALARLLGVSQPMVTKYESGDYNFSLKTLNLLCGTLGLDLKILIGSDVQPCGYESTQIPETDQSADTMAYAA